MSNELEVSEGGSQMFRHAPRKIPFQFSTGDSDLIEEVSKHIEKHLGSDGSVFHEIVSDLVHVDVHFVKPTKDRPFHSLVTSGMAEAPMTVPEGYDGPRYVELCCALPPDWRPPTNEEIMGKKDVEALYWPMRWLKRLARLPHEYDTFLGWGHTVPNGDPAEPFHTSVPFCCMYVGMPFAFPPEFAIMHGSQRDVMFLQMFPLFPEEQELKLRKGADAVEKGWEKHRILPWDMFNASRPNVGKRKFLGWF